MYRLYVGDDTSFTVLNPYLNPESFSASSEENLEERANFKLVCPLSIADKVLVNNRVNLQYEPGDFIMFRGIITSVTRSYISSSTKTNLVELNVSCDGFEVLTSRVPIIQTADYVNFKAGDYIRSVLGLATSYGITAGVIEDGVTVTTPYNAMGRTLRDLLNDMAEICGFTWWIDYQSKLHFRQQKPTLTCPYNLDVDVMNSTFDGRARSIVVEESLNDYFNCLLLIGESDEDGKQNYVYKENAAEIARLANGFGNGKITTTIDNSVIPKTSLDSVADSILASGSSRNLTATFTTNSGGYAVNQKLYLRSCGFQGYFSVKSLNMSLVTTEDLEIEVVAELIGIAEPSLYFSKTKSWQDKWSNLVNKDNPPSQYRQPFVPGPPEITVTEVFNGYSFIMNNFDFSVSNMVDTVDVDLT